MTAKRKLPAIIVYNENVFPADTEEEWDMYAPLFTKGAKVARKSWVVNTVRAGVDKVKCDRGAVRAYILANTGIDINGRTAGPLAMSAVVWLASMTELQPYDIVSRRALSKAAAISLVNAAESDLNLVWLEVLMDGGYKIYAPSVMPEANSTRLELRRVTAEEAIKVITETGTCHVRRLS